MKKIIAFFSVFLFTIGFVIAQSGPVFQFENTNDTYNFGTVTDGEVVVYEYKFKNAGNAPLVIHKAEAGCNCTSAEWPTKPIMPGQSGSIKVTYKSEGNVGTVNKQIYIKSNAVMPAKYKSRYELKLLGTVVTKK